MAAVGHAEENGYADRVIRMIKEEEVALNEYPGLISAKLHVGRFTDDVYHYHEDKTMAEIQRAIDDSYAHKYKTRTSTRRPPVPKEQEPETEEDCLITSTNSIDASGDARIRDTNVKPDNRVQSVREKGHEQ